MGRWVGVTAVLCLLVAGCMEEGVEAPEGITFKVPEGYMALTGGALAETSTSSPIIRSPELTSI